MTEYQPARTPSDARDAGLRRIRTTTAGIAIAAVAGTVAVAGAAYASTIKSSAGTNPDSGQTSVTNDGSYRVPGFGDDGGGGGFVGGTGRGPQAHSGGS